MIADLLSSQTNTPEGDKSILHVGASKRKLPHFRYERIDSSNCLKSLDQKGWESAPNQQTGIIQRQILEGIYDVEKDDNQAFVDMWCEARLPNGSIFDVGPSADRVRAAGVTG